MLRLAGWCHQVSGCASSRALPWPLLSTVGGQVWSSASTAGTRESTGSVHRVCLSAFLMLADVRRRLHAGRATDVELALSRGVGHAPGEPRGVGGNGAAGGRRRT